MNPDVDSVELGIQPQDAPIVNSMIRKVEESTGGSSPLNQGEAKNLVEILDKVRAFRLEVPLTALNPRRSGSIFQESRKRLEGQVFQDSSPGLSLPQHLAYILLRAQRGKR